MHEGIYRPSRHADRYAFCMTQIVARIDDSLIAAVDDLVHAGVVASRSEAMRIGLQKIVDDHNRRLTGARIVNAYRDVPQTKEELAGIEASTRALIEEEPW